MMNITFKHRAKFLGSEPEEWETFVLRGVYSEESVDDALTDLYRGYNDVPDYYGFEYEITNITYVE